MGAPIVIHHPSPTGGRRVTIRGQIVGLAHTDGDVVEFLRRAGLPDAHDLLDQPDWVEWRGGRAHHYEAA
ncbi:MULTISPECIES: hypothetical protein [Streptomyces]|uniref:hypothetical protein n=1 Tax=Streptomyces TaxID=1883 RepID=UPI0005B8E5FF|nr:MULTISPECIES: hypothetical protein [Streptomyces]MDP9953197.1 hypothetical protein [Streptomyces sp. DSM 41269]